MAWATSLPTCCSCGSFRRSGQLTSLFFLAGGALAASILTNAICSFMMLSRWVTMPEFSKWLQKGKSKSFLGFAMLLALGRVESLLFITLKVGKFEVGAPIPRTHVLYVKWLGLLTPLLEDVPSVVFTYMASTITGWTPIMTINFVASVVSLTFAILGKVIERMAAKGEAAVKASTSNLQMSTEAALEPLPEVQRLRAALAAKGGELTALAAELAELKEKLK